MARQSGEAPLRDSAAEENSESEQHRPPDPTSVSVVAQRFSRLCAAVVRRLPFGLSRVVPPTLLGFGIINGSTFGVDLLLLTALHGGLGLPVAVSVSVAYACAFALAFVLNRVFNFRSHAPVGRQAVLYAIAVVINYVAFILGVGAGLTAVGVNYQLSRLLAGACEAVFMYAVLRWVVFPTTPDNSTRATRRQG